MNKVGPLENPQETYEYYHLPFCKPEKIEEPGEGLGEALMGFELRGSVYDINFLTEVDAEEVCRCLISCDCTSSLLGSLVA